MAQDNKRSISPRTAMKLAVVAAALLVGLVVGSGCSGGSIDRGQVEACLPISTAAQLDQCLGGAR